MLGEGTGATNNATYVRAFRETLREENPAALVLGEHFFEATDWLQGDQEDSAMNYYGFSLPVRAFLAGVDHRGHPLEIDAADFDHLLTRARTQLPFEIQLSKFNLLGSHDTARILTLLEGDTARLSLAVTLLFTYIGVPCVYYGDEVGLLGGNDPDCRRTFPWDEASWNRVVLAHYRALIAFRRERRVLQESLFVPLYAQGDVYAFARILEDEGVIVIVNRGEEVGLELDLRQLGLGDETLESLFDSETFRVGDGVLQLSVGACESRVLFTR